MIKNKNGFTLVELLVTIVILGIITGMSFPMLRAFRENNQKRQYEVYGESLVAAAKLYIDSNEEDIFKKNSLEQCEYITYEMLKQKNLTKDIEINNTTCNSDNTFVKVKKKDNKYEYTYYLGCGSGSAKLPTSQVSIIFPEIATPHEINRYTCNTSDDRTAPVITQFDIISSETSYNALKATIRLKADDNVTAKSNLKWCLTTDESGCQNTSEYSSYREDFSYTFDGSYNGATKKLTLKVIDEAGNIQSITKTYQVYKTCSQIANEGQYTKIGECSKKCGGGQQLEQAQATDKFFSSTSCTTKKYTNCNTMDCCSKVTTKRIQKSATACSKQCAGGLTTATIETRVLSAFDDTISCAPATTETVTLGCNQNIACTPYVVSANNITIVNCTGGNYNNPNNDVSVTCKAKVNNISNNSLEISSKIGVAYNKGTIYKFVASADGETVYCSYVQNCTAHPVPGIYRYRYQTEDKSIVSKTLTIELTK